MIRFKVVRASRIMLFLAALILAAVLSFIVARYVFSQDSAATLANVSLVRNVGVGTLVPAPVPTPDAVAVQVTKPSPSPVQTYRPSVLIYHTHTHEAYEQAPEDPYDALEAWRTMDENHSVVKVGEELARCLEGLGFDVIHDTTDCEGTDLPTAYTRSLQMLQGYDRPFDLYIDLHRDAWSEGMPLRYMTEDGQRFAQPMLLIGNGNGFDEKPFTDQNLAFAKALTRHINIAQPGLCRDVLVKDGRYNQHIGVFSILIEVGHNKNTLAEALAAVPAIAQGIRETFDQPTPELKKYMAAL